MGVVKHPGDWVAAVEVSCKCYQGTAQLCPWLDMNKGYFSALTQGDLGPSPYLLEPPFPYVQNEGLCWVP